MQEEESNQCVCDFTKSKTKISTETKVFEQVATHANRASTTPSILISELAPNVASHRDDTKSAHMRTIRSGLHSGSMIPPGVSFPFAVVAVPVLAKSKAEDRDMATYCSAMRRIPIREVIV